MKEISICIQTHKNGEVNINIQIPTDKVNVESEQEIKANREMKNQKELDLGYELEDIAKKWYDTEDEGRIYDNLD